MTRCAVYFAPAPDSRFEEIGASALGRHARTGELVRLVPVEGIDGETLHALTASPRRYGFHGTLKAPFPLTDGKSEADVLTAVGTLAQQSMPFEIPVMKIGILDRFVALVPAEPCQPLQALASRCVQELDELRAPMSDADYARRKPETLSEPQRQLLMAWGYPYVLDEFRFHMTLSERVTPDHADMIANARGELFAEILTSPISVDAISVFRQPSTDEPFLNIAQFPLGLSRVG